jgi:hypothetical protein
MAPPAWLCAEAFHEQSTKSACTATLTIPRLLDINLSPNSPPGVDDAGVKPSQ